MIRKSRGFRGALGAALLSLAVGACDDLLEVQDPGRFVDEDLDQALEAVANGVEGSLYSTWDYNVIQRGLMSDEYRHTGTWAPWDDLDKGRIIYGNSQTDTYQDLFLQTRWFAQDAQSRFERVLGTDAATSPLMVQVKSVEAWADLMIGSAWCEAPLEPGAAAAPREQVLAQASSRAAAAAQLAQSAGQQDFYYANVMAQARAQLYLGNLDAAAQLASEVPTDWSKDALYSSNSPGQNNSIVTLTTATFNTAAGLRNTYWDWVDTDADRLIDPWTGELDNRLPIRFRDNRGVDGLTDHYSQWKYTDRGSNIRLFSGVEARLIEAEAAWADGDLAAALSFINEVRTRAGLSEVGDAGSTAAEVFDYLAHERFAEFFLEGHRMVDLYRWGLQDDLMASGVYIDGISPRAALFPLSRGEGQYNDNIEDARSARCEVTVAAG